MSLVVALLACPAAEQDAESVPGAAWPRGDLVAVDVVDSDYVVVVAASGDVYVSRDSGDSWASARLSSTARGRDVSMADREVGWVLGESGIWRTGDGGASWRSQSPRETSDGAGLRAIAAIDRDRVVALAAGGNGLRTEDGGRSWRAIEDGATSAVARGHRPSSIGLACHRGGDGLCWSAGAAIERTLDGGLGWSAVELDDSMRIEPIAFGLGEVEVDASQAAQIVGSIEEMERGFDPEWQLEPRVSQLEIERLGRRRDPDALFEVIAARIDESRALLENAGVDLDRVVVVAAPPWDYANYLDDDPHFLDRYWRARAATTPSVSIRAVESRGMTAIDLHVDGFGLAVGESGRSIRSVDVGKSWIELEPLTHHDLYDVAVGRDRAVVVGAQGTLLVSEDRGGHWRTPGSGDGLASFEALRAVSFSPNWELGMIVGDKGRMLRSIDGGDEWRPLRPGDP